MKDKLNTQEFADDVMRRTKLMEEFVNDSFKGIMTKSEFTMALGRFMEEYYYGGTK